MKKYNLLALIIIIIGSLNYAICSIFDLNVLSYLSFGYDIVLNVIYFIIGLAGIVVLFQMIAKKEEK